MEKKFIGTLRTFDQYSNIVLEKCKERRVIGNFYSDIYCGLFIIRGENIVIMGDVDTKKEEEEGMMQSVSHDEYIILFEKEKQKNILIDATATVYD